MNGLGLGPEALNLNIAHDIGAAAIARRLAAKMDAGLVLAGYSRLLIDTNRNTGEPGMIPEISAGVEIPGNQGLSGEAHRARAAIFSGPIIAPSPMASSGCRPAARRRPYFPCTPSHPICPAKTAPGI